MAARKGRDQPGHKVRERSSRLLSVGAAPLTARRDTAGGRVVEAGEAAETIRDGGVDYIQPGKGTMTGHRMRRPGDFGFQLPGSLASDS